jgi:hypothetical protein
MCPSAPRGSQRNAVDSILAVKEERESLFLLTAKYRLIIRQIDATRKGIVDAGPRPYFIITILRSLLEIRLFYMGFMDGPSQPSEIKKKRLKK